MTRNLSFSILKIKSKDMIFKMIESGGNYIL